MRLFSDLPACGGSWADAVHALHMQPPQPHHLAFWPTLFVRVPLPLRASPATRRVSVNGACVSTLCCHGPAGLPYGMLARLIVLFVATEAVRKGVRAVSLGPSLSSFLDALAIARSGGRHGRIRYVYDQIERLAALSLQQQQLAPRLLPGRAPAEKRFEPFSGTIGERFVHWRPGTRRGLRPSGGEPPGGTLVLAPAFCAGALASTIPLDRRVMCVLRGHPLAFDAYVWATHTAARMARDKSAQTVVAWTQLHAQFGYPTQRVKDFARAFLEALRLVRVAWPLLRYHTLPGRLLFETPYPHVDANMRAR